MPVLTEPVPSVGLNQETLRSLRDAQDGQYPAKLPLIFLRAQPLKFVLGNVEHSKRNCAISAACREPCVMVTG